MAVVKKNEPLLYAQVKAQPWKGVPTGAVTRERSRGRLETCPLTST